MFDDGTRGYELRKNGRCPSKLKERYGDIDARRLDRLWRKFDELDMNSVTLPNGYPEKQIPALIRLIKRSGPVSL